MLLAGKLYSRLFEASSGELPPHISTIRWLHLRLLGTAIGVALMPFLCGGQQEDARTKPADAKHLMERVGNPSPQAIKAFKTAGMKRVKAHMLTAPERTKVEYALESLPTLNKQVLEEKLHHLAFVDGVPGEGTGLTSPLSKTGLYDITLRASILDESLSTFLTGKEGRVFKSVSFGNRIKVEGTGTDALTYVLLHESTHVLDKSCGITAVNGRRLGVGIWRSKSDVDPKVASSGAVRTIFRGGRSVDVGQAAGIYDALAETPFVSLYATASPQEDFAELVAWHEIESKFRGTLFITLVDAGGSTLRRWEPLTFPALQQRFKALDALLTSDHCPASP